MPKKSALDKIEYHEKICRLMQKQTFEKIEKIETRINTREVYYRGFRSYTFSCTF